MLRVHINTLLSSYTTLPNTIVLKNVTAVFTKQSLFPSSNTFIAKALLSTFKKYIYYNTTKGVLHPEEKAVHILIPISLFISLQKHVIFLELPIKMLF